MARRFTVPTATRVARDPVIDSLTTQWLIKWPSTPHKWGKQYYAIERNDIHTVELLTAAKRQPVSLVQRNKIIDAVNAAIYNTKRQERLKANG